MLLHSDMRVIRHGLRSGDQNEHGPQARSLVGLLDKATTNSLLLIGFIDRQIRQVSTKLKIGERPRDTDQLAVVTSCDDQIGLTKHLFDAIVFIDWSACSQ